MMRTWMPRRRTFLLAHARPRIELKGSDSFSTQSGLLFAQYETCSSSLVANQGPSRR